MTTPNATSVLAPLVVVSGPSGVGKTTVVNELLSLTKCPLRRAITATTRQARTNEIPGIDYHFWTVPEFQKAIAAGQMLEYAVVHGVDYYGTPRSEVDLHRRTGTGVILVIDVQGAAQIRASTPDAQSVFLTCATWEELEVRLRSRGSETAERIARRLETAKTELARVREFDFVVENHTVKQAALDLETLFLAEFAKRGLSCSKS
ncbi:MAG: guanylate kinase [Gemmataceae bacterium]